MLVSNELHRHITCLCGFQPSSVPVQPQNMARGLKFWIKYEEGLYNLCSKSEGADQLRGDRATDLHLVFA